MSKTDIKIIVTVLERAYGARKNQPSRDPLVVLVKTILSQNTSDINSLPTFDSLRANFSYWESVEKAETCEIAEVIKSGGLGQIKAERIQRALKEIHLKRGVLELDFLDELPFDEAEEWLKQLPGVGNKTANCVLLFAFGKPALPVDTHIFRVSKRLGLINEKASLDEAHEKLAELVPADQVYAFHMLMIEHGRKTCLAQHPHCTQCAMREICPGVTPRQTKGKTQK